MSGSLRPRLLIWLVVLAAAPAQATLLPVAWENLAAISTAILVGKVSHVHVIQGHRVAELQVGRVLRGDPRVERVFFLAEPPHLDGPEGSDDSTRAEADENLLVFLESGERYRQTEQFWRELRRLGRDVPFLLVAHAGRGRMRIVEGEPARVLMQGVKPPSALTDASGRGVLLEPFLVEVSTLVADLDAAKR